MRKKASIGIATAGLTLLLATGIALAQSPTGTMGNSNQTDMNNNSSTGVTQGQGGSGVTAAPATGMGGTAK